MIIDIDAIQTRLDAATPGPWRVINDNDVMVFAGRRSVAYCGGYTTNDDDEEAVRRENAANAELIAHARADLFYLLHEVKELRQQCASLAQQRSDKGGPS